MKIIPTSVPVFIQNLEKQENCTYSTAQLKVFFVGTTPDKRYFSQSFAESIIPTLYSCPVVGYYSEEDEDFKGHNSTQYVYGHVPENAVFEWKTDEDNNTWLIAPVILYTERSDNIGEVARKIVGKQHSLELNPKTLKYKINRYSDGSFKNIEMLSGEFIGLSVLGDNEHPAFTKSGFFTNDETFTEFAAGCRSSFDRFLNFLDSNGGKIEIMEFNFSEYQTKVAEMAQKTMQEFQQSIYTWMSKNGVDGWLLENTENYAVIQEYTETGCAMRKYSISYLDQELVLENPVQVFPRYLTQEEIDNGDFVKKEPVKKDDEEEVNPVEDKPVEDKDAPAGDEEKDEDEEDPKKKKADAAADDDDDKHKKGNCEVENTDDAGSEGVPNATENPIAQEEVASQQVSETAASASVATLSDDERLELEGFRRQDKIALINGYTGDIGQEQLDSFIATVDNYSKEELTNELNNLFRQVMVERKKAETSNQQTATPVTTFQIIPTGTDYDERNPADVINKYKR